MHFAIVRKRIKYFDLNTLGNFMFAPNGDPHQPGNTAQLLSESFKPTSSRGRCMTFWYFMNGPQNNTLYVVLRVPGNLLKHHGFKSILYENLILNYLELNIKSFFYIVEIIFSLNYKKIVYKPSDI